MIGISSLPSRKRCWRERTRRRVRHWAGFNEKNYRTEVNLRKPLRLRGTNYKRYRPVAVILRLTQFPPPAMADVKTLLLPQATATGWRKLWEIYQSFWRLVMTIWKKRHYYLFCSQINPFHLQLWLPSIWCKVLQKIRVLTAKRDWLRYCVTIR